MRNTEPYSEVVVKNKEPQLRRSACLDTRGSEHKTGSPRQGGGKLTTPKQDVQVFKLVKVADRVRMVAKASGRECRVKVRVISD